MKSSQELLVIFTRLLHLHVNMETSLCVESGVSISLQVSNDACNNPVPVLSRDVRCALFEARFQSADFGRNLQIAAKASEPNTRGVKRNVMLPALP